MQIKRTAHIKLENVPRLPHKCVLPRIGMDPPAAEWVWVSTYRMRSTCGCCTMPASRPLVATEPYT
jgi:hypothetical protein